MEWKGFPGDMTDEEYKKLWDKVSSIRVKMIEKNEPCKHEVGDVFYYKNPYVKPEGLCNALLHVLDLYTWRVVMGFPSWESDNRRIFRIHCPSKKGTVWEMQAVSEEERESE